MKRSLRILFTVQGDGRGHMTQALALAPMLRRAGHTVTGALVGVGPYQRPPAFFREALAAPVVPLAAPTFVTGRGGRIRPLATGLRALASWRQTSASLDAVTAVLDRHEPDVIVSFFDGLTAFHGFWRSPEAPIVSVGHQFMFEHPEYPFEPGQPVQREAMRAYARFVGHGAVTRLALSFYNAPEASAGTTIIGPLLRPQVMRLDASGDDGSLLVYLMNPAMADRLIAWSDRNPGVTVHCFSSGTPHRHSEALTFHALDGEAFLRRMARARGVVCTAGFESVSEAMWMGKPICMVPTPGHYEQRCNARDALALGGTGVTAPDLARGLDDFADYLPTHTPAPEPFREWVRRAEPRAVAAIERAAGLTPLASGDGATRASNRPGVPTLRPLAPEAPRRPTAS